MVQIDRSNTAIVGLDLYAVAERHQLGLVNAIKAQVQSWKSNPYFISASVHQSLDGVRVFGRVKNLIWLLNPSQILLFQMFTCLRSLPQNLKVASCTFCRAWMDSSTLEFSR
jgi:hypothetical protein